MWQNFRNILLKTRRLRRSDPAVVTAHKKTSKNTDRTPEFSFDRSSVTTSRIFSICRRSVIFILTFAWFGVFAPMGLDFHHDGVVFIPALRVAAGEVVFRDVFCQYGLLSPLLQGFAAWIGGGELLFVKYFSVLFYAGIAVVLDLVWEPLLSARWRNVIFLMFLGLMPDTIVTFHAWSSIFALFFSLLSLWMMLKHLAGKGWWTLFLCGIFAGLTFLSRHPVGVVTVVAMAGALFVEVMLKYPAKERFMKFLKTSSLSVGTALLVIAAAAIYLICNNAWDDFVLQCYTNVSKFVHERSDGSSWGYLSESLFPFITDAVFFDSIFAVLPLTAMAWLLIAVRRAVRNKGESEKDYMLCAVSIFALGAWHQYYPVPCVRHLFWGGVPFFGLWVLSVKELWAVDSTRRIWCRIAAVLLIVHAVYCSYFRLFSAWQRLETSVNRRQLDIPGIRGMKLTRAEYAMLTGVLSTIEQLPEDIRRRGVLNYTAEGLWSVILPPTRFSHVQFLWLKDALYPDFEEKHIQYIRMFKPVVLHSKPIYLGRYIPLVSWQYMGVDYTISIPLE